MAFYWLVDPMARTLEVRRLDRGGRHVTLLAAATGAHEVVEHEGLTVDLDQLWREVDGLPLDEEPDTGGDRNGAGSTRIGIGAAVSRWSYPGRQRGDEAGPASPR